MMVLYTQASQGDAEKGTTPVPANSQVLCKWDSRVSVYALQFCPASIPVSMSACRLGEGAVGGNTAWYATNHTTSGTFAQGVHSVV